MPNQYGQKQQGKAYKENLFVKAQLFFLQTYSKVMIKGMRLTLINHYSF